MRPLTLAAATLALTLAGCSLTERSTFPEAVDADPAVTFSFRGEGHSVVARIDDRDILSPDVHLGRFQEGAGFALRGTAFGRPVTLDAGPSAVTGLMGGGPLDLRTSRAGAAVRAQGVVRGRTADFQVDGEAIAGTLGVCSYDLSRRGDRYEGRRSCGGPTEQVTLRLPVSLGQWGDAEAAAAMAVLLGGAG
jgi:hypothetical protein